MGILGTLVIIMVFAIIYILLTYNKLVRGNYKIEQARASIDIYLKQRFDLIPNLVECVKGYCKHERETLEEVIKLRSLYYDKDQDINVGSELNSKLNNLVAVAENYPELKANEQFLMLQKSLSKMEDQLQAARRLYNAEVTSYNIAINTFPSNIVATIFYFTAHQLFEIEGEEETQNVNINLTDENQ